MGLASAKDVTHRKPRWGFWDFERVSELSGDLPREKKVDFRLLAEDLGRCRTRRAADEKASIERVCLTPYVETFKLKGNKKFRTGTKKS